MGIEELIAMKLPLDGLWLPQAASTMTDAVDKPYWLIYYTCVVSFILIVLPMFYFMFRYKRRHEGQKAESQEDHNQLIEIVWSGVPLIFFVIIFVWGFRGYLAMQMEPNDSMPIYVRGFQWGWELTYVEDSDRNPLADTARIQGRETFVVPGGRPVKLIMTSSDVIHSFFIPNFRQKADVLPGRYTTVWFEVPDDAEHPGLVASPNPDLQYPEVGASGKPMTKNERIIFETMNMVGGEYPIFCTEYCGKDHSRMLSMFKVVPPAQYNKWVAAVGAPGGPSVARGMKIYGSVCSACHSVDGSKAVGPSFKGIWMRKGTDATGKPYVADDAYIKESILEPNRRVVNGYPAAMPAQKLDEDEIRSVVMYMQSLSGVAPAAGEAGKGAADGDAPGAGTTGEDAAGKGAAGQGDKGADAAEASGEKAAEEKAEVVADAEEETGVSVKRGQAVYGKVCIACHSVDGTRRVGPTLKAMYNSDVEDVEGNKYKLDEAGLMLAIKEPSKNTAKGYPPAMVIQPLTDDAMKSVVEYIKTLK